MAKARFKPSSVPQSSWCWGVELSPLTFLIRDTIKTIGHFYGPEEGPWDLMGKGELGD